MNNQNDDKNELNQAMAAGDEWLRKQGVITDFSINTIIAWILLNFESVENVDMDHDRPKQRLYVRVYLRFWTLFFLTILRRKDRLVDMIFEWLAEYVPTYQISVELKRWKGASRRFKIDSNEGDDHIEKDAEPEGNVIAALKDRKEKLTKDKKDETVTD